MPLDDGMTPDDAKAEKKRLKDEKKKLKNEQRGQTERPESLQKNGDNPPQNQRQQKPRSQRVRMTGKRLQM